MSLNDLNRIFGTSDLYEVLGVERNASANTIKKASDPRVIT